MESQNCSEPFKQIYNDIANCRTLTSEQLINLNNLSPKELQEIIKCYNTLIQSLKDANML